MLLITLMDDPGERWGSLALLVQGLWVALDSLDYGILLKDLERRLEIPLGFDSIPYSEYFFSNFENYPRRTHLKKCL